MRTNDNFRYEDFNICYLSMFVICFRILFLCSQTRQEGEKYKCLSLVFMCLLVTIDRSQLLICISGKMWNDRFHLIPKTQKLKKILDGLLIIIKSTV